MHTSPSHDERAPLLADAHPETTTKPVPPPAPVLAWILAGIWGPVFLGALDGTIVATLLTPIGSYFNKSNQASYLGTSYLLSVAACTPLYGRLSDILGRKGESSHVIDPRSSLIFHIGAMLLGLSLFGNSKTALDLLLHLDRNTMASNRNPALWNRSNNGILNSC